MATTASRTSGPYTIEGTIDHHASQRWPALEEVTIRSCPRRGHHPLARLLQIPDRLPQRGRRRTIPLCRTPYLGAPDKWAFAIWQASTGSYTEAVLLNSKPADHPTTALGTACTLYLTGTSNHPEQPDRPLKDLRGAALVCRA
jgi:hypothetical protein